MRFFWGLRIALPIALGLSKHQQRRFLWLNMTSRRRLVLRVRACGFRGGPAPRTGHRVDLHRYEKWIALGLGPGGACALICALVGRPRQGPSGVISRRHPKSMI